MLMKIQYNAPVVLTFAFICTFLVALQGMGINLMPLFSVSGTMDVTNPLDFFRLFSHVLGHGDWGHLLNNLTFILLLGPILEEKYGSSGLLMMMFITAFVTGVLNIFFFSSGLLGASGIVFMMILLSSIVNLQRGRIPLTFVLVVVLFLGKEFISMFQNNNISEFAHIIGGICGAVFGFNFRRRPTY
ncbi:rhomboid family intramembrane serine protease [Rhodoflexus caldus]|uniref:rhomboid family intramembrane serine protease n=1 Tax=Rhodoflexus caldus TaxID=2891236 RepID=UPI002029DBB0|nr:rhomboid family intramembrane serine protease [Rhodoflexus caldus]